MVGRTRLLSSFDLTLDATEGGRSSAVLLLADPGMGRSTVLDAVRLDAVQRGWSTVVAVAPEGSSRVAFSLVADIVHDLLAGSGRAADGDTQALARVVEPRRWQVQPVATALRDLLVDSAHHAPVVVLVDDLHWADEDSVSALALAASRTAGVPVAVVASAWQSMGDDPRLTGWTQLHLDPLDEADAVAVLQSVLPHTLEAEQATRTARALGCCPLALVECERLLTPAQLAGRAPMPELVPLGERLRHEWALVVAGLPLGAQRGLLAVSVLHSCDPALVDGVLSTIGCTEGDLAPAVRGGLLVMGPRGTPVPASSYVRAAVLDAHDPGDVRAMHGLVADTAIRVDAPVSVVVYHLSRGARVGDAAAVTALEAQAERAHQQAQPEAEARAWQAAAELSREPAQRAARAVRAARVWLSEASSVESAGSLLALLNGSALGPTDAVWREWTRAEALAETDLTEAGSAALLAARHAEVAQPALVPWLLWDAAATSWMADDPELAVEAATRLMGWTTGRSDLARAHVPAWLASAVLGTAYLHAGRIREGVALVQAARATAHAWRSDPTTPLSQLVNVVALDELMVVDGAEEYARVHELASRLAGGGGGTTSSVLAIQGWRACRRGDWLVARTHATESVDLARAVRAPAQERSALMLLTHLLHAVETADGDTATRAQDAFNRLRALAQHAGDRRALAAADRVAGLRALVAGRVGEAAVALDRARSTRCRGRGTVDTPLPAAVDLVEALVVSGDRSAAHELAHRTADQLDAVAALDARAPALAARARALVAQGSEADTHFATALAAHRATGDDFESARTTMLLGEHLRHTRRAAAGRQQLASAALQLEHLGADAWARRAREQAGVLGRGRRGDDPQWRSRLTTAERRVVREVSRGATNAEVASVLSLSVRTVECHLASAYRKLGVRNRVELVNLVHAAGQPAVAPSAAARVSEPSTPSHR
jgi:DNA-binding CsgD family transcriptional regulator